MAHAREIMEMQLNPEHKHFARMLSAKQSMAASILTATARVRDGLLRPNSDDGLDALLARIKGTGLAEDSGTTPRREGLTDVGVKEPTLVAPVLGGLPGVALGGLDDLVTADDLFG